MGRNAPIGDRRSIKLTKSFRWKSPEVRSVEFNRICRKMRGFWREKCCIVKEKSLKLKNYCLFLFFFFVVRMLSAEVVWYVGSRENWKKLLINVKSDRRQRWEMSKVRNVNSNKRQRWQTSMVITVNGSNALYINIPTHSCLNKAAIFTYFSNTHETSTKKAGFGLTRTP